MSVVSAAATESISFSYKCGICNEVHDGCPMFEFNAPATIEEYEIIDTDKLLYYHVKEGETSHFFVKTCLFIPIIGHKEPFVWLVWVSLSDASYTRYKEILDKGSVIKADENYFGYLMNHLPPPYNGTFLLSTRIVPRAETAPQVVTMATGSVLATDYFGPGMTFETAKMLGEQSIHKSDGWR